MQDIIQTTVGVFIRDGKVLMEKRRANKKVYPNFLMCPSGHVEGVEELDETFRREMKEELGIDVIKTKFLFAIEDTDPVSRLKFLHNFLLVGAFKGEINTSKEADTLVWKSFSELEKEELCLIVRKLVTRLHEEELF